MSLKVELGNVVRIRGQFQNTQSGALADPGSVSLAITIPAGTTTTYTYPASVTRESVGQFIKEYTPATRGKYTYTWTGSGANAGTDKGNFRVV